MVTFALLFGPSITPLEKLLPGAKIVEDKLSVGAQSFADFLHGFDPRAHHLATPPVEELACPRSGLLIAELPEVFLEQIIANALEVIAYPPQRGIETDVPAAVDALALGTVG